MSTSNAADQLMHRLVDVASGTLTWGEVLGEGDEVVARLGEEVTVKRFRRTHDSIELLPENPDFQTIVVEPGEPFEIEGLAVGLIRNNFLM